MDSLSDLFFYRLLDAEYSSRSRQKKNLGIFVLDSRYY